MTIELPASPSWDDLREAEGYNPGFEAWLDAVEPERKDMWMQLWIEDGLDAQSMLWWLEKVECNEAVAAAEASVQDAPAEFQEAADRGDLEAMGKFLAKRIADQQAGREWI
mgnify:CR=1 FL=1